MWRRRLRSVTTHSTTPDVSTLRGFVSVLQASIPEEDGATIEIPNGVHFKDCSVLI